MLLSRGEADALGIPKDEYPVFKQYVRDHARVDLEGMNEGQRFVILNDFAKEWLVEREKAGVSGGEAKQLWQKTENDRLQAKADEEYRRVLAMQGHPIHRAEDLIPQPAAVGAVPQMPQARMPTAQKTLRGAAQPQREDFEHESPLPGPSEGALRGDPAPRVEGEKKRRRRRRRR